MNDSFASGLDPLADHALTGPHGDDPTIAETMNFWAYDGQRDLALNIHARIHNGEMRGGVTLFLPGGRILRQRDDAPARFDDGSAPRSTHIQYRCQQPFRRWSYAIDRLPAFATSDAAQAAGTIAEEQPTCTFSARLDGVAAAPAWRNGTLTAEARQQMAGPGGLWLAGRARSGIRPDCFRYDQLLEVTGEIEADGVPHAFAGMGLRSHVRGARDLSGMAGTCWMSGLFPGGRGFGVLVNVAEDGRYVVSEACLCEGGVIEPARILQFPRHHRDLDEGRFWIQLASDRLGAVDISGEDTRAFYWSMPDWAAPARGIAPVYARVADYGVVMKQALARYTWNGEIGFGHNERSG